MRGSYRIYDRDVHEAIRPVKEENHMPGPWREYVNRGTRGRWDGTEGKVVQMRGERVGNKKKMRVRVQRSDESYDDKGCRSPFE